MLAIQGGNLETTPANLRRHIEEFAAGARDIIPMMVGAAPFGVIFGTLVAAGPLHLWHGQLMSLVVFAGSAQFIALGLIAGHASFAVIWATTLVVNLRHVLYQRDARAARRASAGALALGARCAAHRRSLRGRVGALPASRTGHGRSALLLRRRPRDVPELAALDARRPAVRRGVPRPAIARTRFRDGRHLHRDRRAATRRVALSSRPPRPPGRWPSSGRRWPYKLGLLGAVFAGVAIGVLLYDLEPGRAARAKRAEGTR